MKENMYVLNILLAVLWGLVLGVFVVARAVYPAAVLPAINLQLLLAVSLGALLLEHWMAPGGRRFWGGIAGLSALTFGLLPLCAGLVSSDGAVKLAVAGGVVFLVCTVLFDDILQRLAFAPKMKAGAASTAFLLFLAGQCLPVLLMYCFSTDA